jgi:hypothetical protein
MDELPCDDGLSVSGTVSQPDGPDWQDDESLSAWIRAMGRRQRHQVAYLALRRLRAPLLGLPMPADWGVEPAALAALLRTGAARLDGRIDVEFAQAIAEFSAAPLFESEIEPEFAESFQLEALSGWLLLGDALGEMGEADTARIIGLARAMAVYLDDFMDGSLTEVGGGELRERYLADAGDRLRAYGLGYFGTRNLEVEGDCHEVILAAPADEDLLGSTAGLRLAAACDEYSGQLLSALRVFATQ